MRKFKSSAGTCRLCKSVSPAQRVFEMRSWDTVSRGYQLRNLVDELVVDDGGSQTLFLLLALPILGPHHASLTDDIAILLSRDFFRHLEDHLNQRIDRKRLWTANNTPLWLMFSIMPSYHVLVLLTR